MKIVILDGYTLNPGDLSWGPLKELGEVTVYERTAPKDVCKRAEGAEVVFTNKVVLDEAVLEKLPSLKYIGVLATGYNVVDVAAAARKGIVVTNIPAYSTSSVAQMAFAHILNIVQRVGYYAQEVSNGNGVVRLIFLSGMRRCMNLMGKDGYYRFWKYGTGYGTYRSRFWSGCICLYQQVGYGTSC